MAKHFLHSSGVNCDDLTDEDNTECVMEGLMRDVVNGQNHQIQVMRGILEQLSLPAIDDCVVNVTSLLQGELVNATQAPVPVNTTQEPTSGGFRVFGSSYLSGLLGLAVALVM